MENGKRLQFDASLLRSTPVIFISQSRNPSSRVRYIRGEFGSLLCSLLIRLDLQRHCLIGCTLRTAAQPVVLTLLFSNLEVREIRGLGLW